MGERWAETKELLRDTKAVIWGPLGLAWAALMLVRGFIQEFGQLWLPWIGGFGFIAAGAMFFAWRMKRAQLESVLAQIERLAQAAKERSKRGGIDSPERKAWAIDRLLIKCAGVRCSLEIHVRDERIAGRPLAPPSELVCLLTGKSYEKPHWFLQIEFTQGWVDEVRKFVEDAFGPAAVQALVPEKAPHALDGMAEMVKNYQRALENLQRGLDYQPPGMPTDSA